MQHPAPNNLVVHPHAVRGKCSLESVLPPNPNSPLLPFRVKRHNFAEFFVQPLAADKRTGDAPLSARRNFQSPQVPSDHSSAHSNSLSAEHLRDPARTVDPHPLVLDAWMLSNDGAKGGKLFFRPFAQVDFRFAAFCLRAGPPFFPWRDFVLGVAATTDSCTTSSSWLANASAAIASAG